MKIKNKLLLLILILALVPAFAIGLVFYIISADTLKEQIKTTHYKAVTAVDTTIFVVVSDMVNIAFTAAPKIADLIGKQDQQALIEKLNRIDQTSVPKPIGTGRGLGYHIIVVTDEQGYILARANIVVGVETKIAQRGHILFLDEDKQKEWKEPENFRIALERALRGQSDARKIIYNAPFLKREGYGHLVDEYKFNEMMGLTAMQPIFNQEREQIGVLILITILNNNHAAIGAINVITGAEFTAITPAGEIIASFFANPPILNAEIIEKAKERANKIAQGIKMPVGRDAIFYTKERIYLRICPGIIVFKGEEKGTCYVDGKAVIFEELEEKAYRLHFISEADPNLKYVSIRGIAYDLTDFDVLVAAQERSSKIVFLIAFLIIGGLGLVTIQKITSPILKFTKKIQEIEKQGFGEKVDIKTGDEIETLVNSFNSMSEKIAQNYEETKKQKNLLEIRVDEKTKELRNLADSLDKQVKEKTKNLQGKLEELERFHKITIDRETKMIELKKEIAELKKKLGE